MEIQRMNHEQDLMHKIINWVIEYAIIIGTFIFSVIAKVHNILRYKKRMSPMECAIDTFLSGLGSALVIYILHSMNVPLWLLCLLGGYSSLIVTPVSTVISKEITPFLNLVVDLLESWIKKWFKSKDPKS